MTFMDVSRLIRDKLKDCLPENMLKEKQKLAKIFGLKVSIISSSTVSNIFSKAFDLIKSNVI